MRGYDLPLFAVFGGLGTSIAFVVTVLLHPEVAAAGFGWLILGLTTYVVYRRRQGLDLVSTHKVAIPQPVVDHEAEYDSVLVPLVDGVYDAHVIATAAKLAARKRRGIHVLALMTVPNALAIDATDGREVQQRRRLRDRAGQDRRRAAGLGPRRAVRAGQAGRRIIEEASDMRAAAIVMALPRRVDGASAVRQDDRDRARRAPVPGDHRVDAGLAARRDRRLQLLDDLIDGEARGLLARRELLEGLQELCDQ